MFIIVKFTNILIVVLWCAVVVAPIKKLEESKVDQPTDMGLNQAIADDNSYVLPNVVTNTSLQTNGEKTLIDAIKPKHRRNKKASSQY